VWVADAMHTMLWARPVGAAFSCIDCFVLFWEPFWNMSNCLVRVLNIGTVV